MKTLKTERLTNAISIVAPFSAGTSPIESFLCVKVEEVDSGIRLTCCSGMGSASSLIESEDAEPDDIRKHSGCGSCYVPMRRFRDVVSSASCDMLNVIVSKEGIRFKIAKGSISIAATEVTAPLREAVDDIPGCEIQAKRLALEIDAMLSIHDVATHAGIHISGGAMISTVRVGTAAAAWCQPTCWNGPGEAMLPIEHGKAFSAFLSKAGGTSATCRIAKRGIFIQCGNSECFVRTAEMASIVSVKSRVHRFVSTEIGTVVVEDFRKAVGACKTVCLEESRQVGLSFTPTTIVLKKKATAAGSAEMTVDFKGVEEPGCLFDSLLLHRILAGLSGKEAKLSKIAGEEEMEALKIESAGVTIVQMSVSID